MPIKKIRGIYLRGKTYWLTHGSGKRRMQVSLETSDYATAVANAQAILDQPLLNTTEGFKADLDSYAEAQVRDNVWTANSKNSKCSVLLMLGEDLDWTPLPKITKAQLQRWYDQQVKRIAVVTANAYITTIKSFLNWAIGQNILARNPADDLKLRKTDEAARERFCTFKERDLIIRNAPDDNLRFILFSGFYAGFRKNEIIEARPDWFDVELEHVLVKKTDTFKAKDKEERTIPMAKEFRKFLKRFGKPSPFMLEPTVVHGKATYRYDFRKPFTDYMRSIGFEWVTPHVMRHSFASLLAIRGCSLFKIAQWLGDSLRVTEKHYAHLLPNDPDIEMLNGSEKPRKKRSRR